MIVFLNWNGVRLRGESAGGGAPIINNSRVTQATRTVRSHLENKKVLDFVVKINFPLE